jgi:hypothetical protein
MEIDFQRLRNLTTHKLHTDISYVYKDLGTIFGSETLMTHQLPNVLTAVTPWLKRHVKEPKFWENSFDPSHIGFYKLPMPTDEDWREMREIYNRQPNPLNGKNIIVGVL